MAQLTIRLDDELADDLRRAAAAEGTSLNQFTTTVLRAAVDPDAAGDEFERFRERLARAGLLMPTGPPSKRPDPKLVARARKAASKGTPLSDLVIQERDENR